MAKSTSARARKAREAARSAGSNPYVRRVIEDEELRDSVRQAFEAARHAYQRMANGKGPAKALMEDKKVQRDLRTAAESLRDASEHLRGKRRRRLSLGKLLLVGIIVVGGIVLISEDTRKALLDRLFGAEEEFEYSSTTAPEPETTTAS